MLKGDAIPVSVEEKLAVLGGADLSRISALRLFDAYEALLARLAQAIEFAVPCGPYDAEKGPQPCARICWVSVGQGKTRPGWYVLRHGSSAVLTVSGEWNEDHDDDWDDRHRFETADAAFEALAFTEA